MDPEVVTLGYKIWTAFRPWKRLQKWRNKIRARHGKPPLPGTEDDVMEIPSNTFRKLGIGLVSATPIIVAVLDRFGVHECTPDETAMGCVGAAAMVGAAISLFGGATYWYGRNRAEKAAAAAKAPGP